MKAALLYYRGSGFAAWFIRGFTKSKYAHVAPAILDDAGSLVAYNAFWSSGVTRTLGADLVGCADVQWLSFDENTLTQKAEWLDAQVGKTYDKWSIVLIGFTKRVPGWLHVYVSRQGEWICSRLAADFAALELACWGLNGPPSPEDVHQIMEDMHRIKGEGAGIVRESYASGQAVVSG